MVPSEHPAPLMKVIPSCSLDPDAFHINLQKLICSRPFQQLPVSLSLCLYSPPSGLLPVMLLELTSKTEGSTHLETSPGSLTCAQATLLFGQNILWSPCFCTGLFWGCPNPAPSALSFLASCLPHWAPGLEQISPTDSSGDLVASLFKNKTRGLPWWQSG